VTALTALADVQDIRITNGIMTFLHDHSIEVRKAAAGTLLWDANNRWQTIRNAIRSVLSDQRFANDGPLPCLKRLPPNAITDLVIWSSDVGVIGRRSTQTLITYYRQLIQEDAPQALVGEYQTLIFDPTIPAAIRVELACSLRDHNCLTDARFARLMEPQHPASLRVIGAEVALAIQKDPSAIAILREIASQPNRQLALAVARVVQKYLNLDMGLPLHEAIPTVQSKQGAEVTRRVMAWAARKPIEEPLLSAESSAQDFENQEMAQAKEKPKSKVLKLPDSSPLIDSETLFSS
jgi:hypothetical protein